MFSLLDGFSGYNQVLVTNSDQLKTSFKTPWGTFSYRRMPFGLINAGATFQRAIDIAFQGLLQSSVVVYLDDITIFTKKWHDHSLALRHVFDRSRKYSISLNPKKSVFAVLEGKLLGFIFSKDKVIIDPERVEAIEKVGFPGSKKAMQSFLGKINFVRRFVPNFAHIVRPLQDLVKKDFVFKYFDV